MIFIYIYLYKIKPPYRRYDFYITMTIAPCPGESYDEAEVAWSFQPGDEARPEESQSLARACCELASGFLRQMILPGSNWIPLAIDFHPLGFHVLWDGWFPNAIMPLLISFFGTRIVYNIYYIVSWFHCHWLRPSSASWSPSLVSAWWLHWKASSG